MHFLWDLPTFMTDCMRFMCHIVPCIKFENFTELGKTTQERHWVNWIVLPTPGNKTYVFNTLNYSSQIISKKRLD